MERRILVKSIKLHKLIEGVKNKSIDFETIKAKFHAVWGEHIGSHFLSKYDDAESLIHALDSQNLELFIEKY